MKILFGVLLGVLITLIAYLSYTKFVFDVSKNEGSELIPAIKNLLRNGESLGELRINIAEVQEKVNSLHKRIDDLYIFGGIIITLLLAINISVYVRAEAEANRHFKENYEKYLIMIRKYVQEAEEITARLKARTELIPIVKETLGPKQTRVNDGNNN